MAGTPTQAPTCPRCHATDAGRGCRALYRFAEPDAAADAPSVSQQDRGMAKRRAGRVHGVLERGIW